MRALRLALALAVVASGLSACGPQTGPAGDAPIPAIPPGSVPVTHDLVRLLPTAKIDWQAGWKRPFPSAALTRQTIEQMQGSSIRYFFVLPEAARLRGAAIWLRDQQDPAADRRLTLELAGDDGRSAVLVQHEFSTGPASRVSFEQDLSGYAGQRVSIGIRLSEPRPERVDRSPQTAALRWHGLELTGVERRAAPLDSSVAPI